MRHQSWNRAVIFSTVYGIGAFAIGFVFGALRELALRPLLGEPGAHWAEFPFVTAAVCVLGYRLGQRIHKRAETFLIGLCGVGMLLLVEGAFALGLMRQPLDVFLAGFDIRRGALFPLGLIAMALAPRAGWRGR